MERHARSSGGRGYEVLGIVLMALAVLLMLSLVSYSGDEYPNSSVDPSQSSNWGGRFGAVAAYGLFVAVGYAAFVIPLAIFAWGWNRFRRLPVRKLTVRTAGIAVLVLSYCSILALFQQDETVAFRFAGFLGLWMAQQVWQPCLGQIGSAVLIAALVAITLVLTMDIPLSGIAGSVAQALGHWLRRILSIRRGGEGPVKDVRRPARAEVRTVAPGVQKPTSAGEVTVKRESVVTPSMIEFPVPRIVESPPFETEPEERADKATEGPSADGGEIRRASPRAEEQPASPRRVIYQLPSVDLFDGPPVSKERQTKEQLLESADKLEASLRDFGVEARVAHISPGPVITCYAVEPAAGVKVGRIISLADDLALVMKAKRIRVAPMLGKSTVGVEVPNPRPSVVYLRDVLQSEAYRSVSSKLKVALGKTTSGDSYVTDLAGMPHLLIAGATGSGKSVCLHSIISSLLYNATPEEVRLIMVDPKMLELPVYNGIPHLLAPVVTQPRRATEALRWAVNEMDVRYRHLAGFGVRNIQDYNAQVEERLAEEQGAEADAAEFPSPLPFVVIIIDELADLMMTAADDIEDPIARLAQMARAVGIHLILATQRPSVDVITGVIKANFPARLAFQVASKVDSRTVLDMNGAEKLLGNGDMLFLPSGQPEPIRVHGSFVSSKETERLVAMIRKQRIEAEQVEIFEENEAVNAGGWDELFNEAARVVVSLQQGSVSLLQRRFKIGYARAGRLMDQLEAAGIVGPADGSKAREVLVDGSYLDDLEQQ